MMTLGPILKTLKTIWNGQKLNYKETAHTEEKTLHFQADNKNQRN